MANSNSTNMWGVISERFLELPKWLRIIIFFLFIAASLFILYNRFNPTKTETEEKVRLFPNTVTITGQLIERNSQMPLTNVTVSDENNHLIKDERVDDDGTYKLENIVIPDTKLISLLITYPDGSTASVSDIDVSQINLVNGRLIIPLKEVKDWEEKPSRKPSNNPNNLNLNLKFKNADNLKKSFRVLPFGNTKLEKLISNTGLKLSKVDPSINVEITYSGQIEKIDNDLYRYDGGSIEITVNDIICNKLESLIIKPSFRLGNRKEAIIIEINNQIIELSESNIDEIFKKIKPCLN